MNERDVEDRSVTITINIHTLTAAFRVCRIPRFENIGIPGLKSVNPGILGSGSGLNMYSFWILLYIKIVYELGR